MAAAVFEAVEGEPQHAALPIEVVPGISALLAAAARLGAPLGHDFCAISLSDNLKPWPTVLTRLQAAAEAGFVLALYNPASRSRPWQLGAAFDALRTVLPAATPVAFATAISRADERLVVTTLARADPGSADMRTLVVVGSAATRVIARPGGGLLALHAAQRRLSVQPRQGARLRPARSDRRGGAGRRHHDDADAQPPGRPELAGHRAAARVLC